MRSDARGFTLLEVLIVAAVICVLAAIAIPHYADMRARSLDAKVVSAVREVATGEEAYYAGQQRYTGSLDDLSGVVTGGVTIKLESGNSGDLGSSFRVRGTLAGAAHEVVWLSDPAPGESRLTFE